MRFLVLVNQFLLWSVVAGFTLVNFSFAAPSEDGQAIPRCVMEQPDAMQTLWQLQSPPEVRDGQVRRLYNFLYHPCTGGLYIDNHLNAPAAGLFQPLWQGWWLQELYKPNWLDENTVLIRGLFITGVGPSAGEKFAAEITIRRTTKGWVADEPTLREDPFPQPTTLQCRFERLWVVEDLDAYNMFDLPDTAPEVDFNTHRLLLKKVNLGNRGTPQVKVTSDQYLIFVKRARLGTAFYAPGILWVVLPKDERSIALGRTPGMRTCESCRVGTIAHAYVKWRQSPHSLEHNQKPRKPWLRGKKVVTDSDVQQLSQLSNAEGTKVESTGVENTGVENTGVENTGGSSDERLRDKSSQNNDSLSGGKANTKGVIKPWPAPRLCRPAKL